MCIHNYCLQLFIIAPSRRFLGASLLILVTFPLSAAELSGIDLTSNRSKLTVSCDARPVTNSTNAPPRELLEWCVKACDVHGYYQLNGYGLAEVSDYTLPPRLNRSFWPWARKMTPSQCLPYQPVTKKQVGNERCLEYRRRLTIKGMLASYNGWELTLKDPSPGCILGDPGDPRRRPEANTLNGISLIIPKADLGRFERRIGEQVVVSGRLEYRVNGDTDSINLMDVELLDTNIAPD